MAEAWERGDAQEDGGWEEEEYYGKDKDAGHLDTCHDESGAWKWKRVGAIGGLLVGGVGTGRQAVEESQALERRD